MGSNPHPKELKRASSSNAPTSSGVGRARRASRFTLRRAYHSLPRFTPPRSARCGERALPAMVVRSAFVFFVVYSPDSASR